MERITVKSTIGESVQKVWDFWSDPIHIVNWNAASDEWHTTQAKNDLRVGGSFTSRMEAKDKSSGFDFSGTYDEVISLERISYTMDDGRKVEIDFIDDQSATKIICTFDAEDQHSAEMQRDGWQAILDSFQKYVENYQ